MRHLSSKAVVVALMGAVLTVYFGVRHQSVLGVLLMAIATLVGAWVVNHYNRTP